MIDRRMQVVIESSIDIAAHSAAGLELPRQEYAADIDYKLAYSNLDEKLKDLEQFAKEILEFLEKQR